MEKKFTLGRTERLKSRKRIEEIFKRGQKLSVSSLRLIWVLEKNTPDPVLQFGAGVSTRNFKKAVDRNRVKRLLREAWRIQKNDLKAIVESEKISVFAFVTYNGHELPLQSEVNEKIGKLLKMLTEQITG